MNPKVTLINYEEIKSNRNSFLSNHKKHGLNALKLARGVRDYIELSERLKCNASMASTIINELLAYGLYEKNKEGKLKRTKGLIRVGISPKKIENEISERTIKTRKIRKTNSNSIRKEIENYIKSNFKKIKNPFNEQSFQNIKENNLKKSSEFLITILDSNLDFESIDGLGIRFYDAFAHYFSINRAKKEEMTNAFSTLIKNFEPYIKKLVYSKTNDIKKARISLNQTLLKFIIRFDSDLNNSNKDYWADKRLCEACIRYVYPFRHIEAHESRNWEIFQMEKAIFYMFASIILINLEFHQK